MKRIRTEEQKQKAKQRRKEVQEEKKRQAEQIVREKEAKKETRRLRKNQLERERKQRVKMSGILIKECEMSAKHEQQNDRLEELLSKQTTANVEQVAVNKTTANGIITLQGMRHEQQIRERQLIDEMKASASPYKPPEYDPTTVPLPSSPDANEAASFINGAASSMSTKPAAQPSMFASATKAPPPQVANANVSPTKSVAQPSVGAPSMFASTTKTPPNVAPSSSPAPTAAMGPGKVDLFPPFSSAEAPSAAMPPGNNIFSSPIMSSGNNIFAAPAGTAPGNYIFTASPGMSTSNFFQMGTSFAKPSKKRPSSQNRMNAMKNGSSTRRQRRQEKDNKENRPLKFGNADWRHNNP